jgi:hypothetical protein
MFRQSTSVAICVSVCCMCSCSTSVLEEKQTRHPDGAIEVHKADAASHDASNQPADSARPSAAEDSASSWEEEIESAVATRRGKTALSILAAQMEPGSWATLDTGRPEDLMWVTNSEGKRFHIAGWTDDGYWDSRTGQFLFYGFRQARKFIAYSEEDNAWRVVPEHYPWPLETAMGHIYGNNAHDPVSGTFYHNAPNAKNVYAYDLAVEQWQELPQLPVGRGRYGTSLEYFRELGGLVRHADGVLHLFDEGSAAWSVLGTTEVCGYHSLARRNPYLGEMLLAGGDETRHTVEKIDSEGKITRLKDSPVPLSIRMDKLVVDPVSKRYLLFTDNLRVLHEFDSVTDTYVKVTGYSKPSFGRYALPVPASIPEYGVIMFIDAKTRLYKHRTVGPGE